MKRIINTTSCDGLFEGIRENDFFTCEEKTCGLRLKYNTAFTAIGSPRIFITKISDKQAKISLSQNPVMLVITIIITAFFWLIALLAAKKSEPNIAGIVIALVSPSVMWITDILVFKGISKLIIEDIEKIGSDKL